MNLENLNNPLHPRRNCSGKSPLLQLLEISVFALLCLGIGFFGGMLFSSNDQTPASPSPTRETIPLTTKDPRLEVAAFFEATRLNLEQLWKDIYEHPEWTASLYQGDINISAADSATLAEMQLDWLAKATSSKAEGSSLHEEFYQDHSQWDAYVDAEMKKMLETTGGSSASFVHASRREELALRRIEQLKDWIRRFDSEKAK